MVEKPYYTIERFYEKHKNKDLIRGKEKESC